MYDWLARSDAGVFAIRGRFVTIDYFQGGQRGQGRIRIDSLEVDRLLELMKVHPNTAVKRRPAPMRLEFPHITVKLGRPER
ncbi:MAG: DNA-binding protein [Pirellulaceae bacterium]